MHKTKNFILLLSVFIILLELISYFFYKLNILEISHKPKMYMKKPNIPNYEWWTEDPVRITELLFEDLPSYSGATIRVIITATNETVLCGVLVIGNDLELGCTLHGMGLSIQDFSIKQTDAFGNTSVLERAFKREVTARVIADNDSVDAIFNELAKLRARPTVYVGSTDFGASMAYGFFKDFNIDVALPTKSFISIEIEGLT